jgi:hypothetical protein
LEFHRITKKNPNLKAFKDDTAEIERILKALIKSLENKRLNPCPRQASLDPLSPRTLFSNSIGEEPERLT